MPTLPSMPVLSSAPPPTAERPAAVWIYEDQDRQWILHPLTILVRRLVGVRTLHISNGRFAAETGRLENAKIEKGKDILVTLKHVLGAVPRAGMVYSKIVYRVTEDAAIELVAGAPLLKWGDTEAFALYLAGFADPLTALLAA